ncbi:MAG: CaiB/BaiF CoA transferase family protein [Candidatus Limnocylindrales bacterium]
MSEPAGLAGALSGIRIVDLTQVAAGPLASSMLGDLGADVIKVEPPGGDSIRYVDHVFGPRQSSYFTAVNRSKRSIVLDLKLAADRDDFDRLLGMADVLLVSMRPAALRDLALEAPAVQARFPRLIHVAITAFGTEGPLAGLPGMDITAQAFGGIMGLTGTPDGPPLKAGAAVADFATSYLTVAAVLAALRTRDRDGVAPAVELDLFDTVISMLSNFITAFDTTRVPIGRLGGGHPQLVPYQTFETLDGHFVIGCIADRFWPKICAALGATGLSTDPSLATNPGRLLARERVVSEIELIMKQRTSREWEVIFAQYDVPAAPVLGLEELLDHPQVTANRTLQDFRHDAYGSYRAPRTPITTGAGVLAATRPAPTLDEHGAEIRRELEQSEPAI